MKIKIFAVGGTIDKIYFDKKSHYEVGEPTAGKILAENNVTLEYEVESLFRKDSLDMTAQDRRALRERISAEPCQKIIVTHGTDTMTITALDLKGIVEKTIVLTGSIEPAMSKTSDAAFNIGCAVAGVQTLPPGVYVAMNGRIFDPATIRKNREENRFEEI